MRIISLAKAMLPQIHEFATLEAIYKIMMNNKLIPFKQLLSYEDMIRVVFIAGELSRKRDPMPIIQKLETDLFTFSKVEFDKGIQEEDCDRCDGAGTEQCSKCLGNGEVRCRDCHGEGCDECEYGSIICPECEGNGYVVCEKCEGEGYVTLYEYIPYTITEYVSYDKQLFESINQTMLRNQEAFRIRGFQTFMLNEKITDVRQGLSEDIKEKFAEKEYFLDVELGLDGLSYDIFGDRLLANLDNDLSKFVD